jgi:hypothetical protein
MDDPCGIGGGRYDDNQLIASDSIGLNARTSLEVSHVE